MPRPPRLPPSLLILPAVAGLMGCPHRPPAHPVSDPSADLAAAADAARAFSTVGDDPVACVILSSLGSALDVASEAWGGAGIPPVQVDVSACGLVLAPLTVAEDSASIANAIGLGLRLASSRIIDPCAREWTVAAVGWSTSAVAAALDEVAQPDGLVEVPGVTIDAGACRP